MRSSACSIAGTDSPAEPNTPRKPARAIASTISTEPIPLAIAPDMHANRSPWRARKWGSPRCSSRHAGTLADGSSPLPVLAAANASETISWRPERSIRRNDSATRDKARSSVSASVGATTTMVLRKVSVNQRGGVTRVSQSGSVGCDWAGSVRLDPRTNSNASWLVRSPARCHAARQSENAGRESPESARQPPLR